MMGKKRNKYAAAFPQREAEQETDGQSNRRRQPERYAKCWKIGWKNIE
jgi:hypothetical protein